MYLLQHLKHLGYGIAFAFLIGEWACQGADIWPKEDCLEKFIFGKLFGSEIIC